MNERDLVARARELFSDRIGDDAAVVGDQVLTTDMLVEDVDFTRDIPIRFIARKTSSPIASAMTRPSSAIRC